MVNGQGLPSNSLWHLTLMSTCLCCITVQWQTTQLHPCLPNLTLGSVYNFYRSRIYQQKHTHRLARTQSELITIQAIVVPFSQTTVKTYSRRHKQCHMKSQYRFPKNDRRMTDSYFFEHSTQWHSQYLSVISRKTGSVSPWLNFNVSPGTINTILSFRSCTIWSTGIFLGRFPEIHLSFWNKKAFSALFWLVFNI